MQETVFDKQESLKKLHKDIKKLNKLLTEFEASIDVNDLNKNIN